MSNEQRIAQIQTLLKAKLEPSFLEISDDSQQHIGHAGARGGAGHFSVTIASSYFKDKSRIACHKMIYAALDSMIPQDIHALQIKISD